MLTFEKKYPHYEEGSYAVVFFTEDGRATKIFRQRSDISENEVERVFQSEVQAYAIASEHTDLCCFIPDFYGIVSVQKVTDATGLDISNNFYLNLAYQMQRIEGKFEKLKNQKYHIIDRFHSAGVSYTGDASFIIKNGEITCIIDFATQFFELEHS